MVPFQTTSDLDLLKAILFNRSRLSATGCWEWVGSKDSGGYGLISRKSKTLRAHRVSYEAYNGEIPNGMVVCHSCDNPSCINPGHLRADTQKNNVIDRELRNRRNVVGESVGTAKLTKDDVLAIRSSDKSLSELSKFYNVDRSSVWNAKTGKTWKHLHSLHGQ